MFSGTRALESRLAAAVEAAAHSLAGPGGVRPLEIVEQAVGEITRHVHPAGRGKYVFPFNQAAVTFAAPSPEDEAQFDAICAGPPTLQERLLRGLASAGSEPVDVEVSVGFAIAPDPAWTRPEFHIALARVSKASRPQCEPSLRIELIVTHGTADRGAYSFTSLPVAIGRGTEVRDSRLQLVRLNHVAFLEGGDEVTQSVSRRHARIELDGATERVRLIDDNSAQGTSIIRGGRGVAVPRGSYGLSLQSGDEIVLGQARVRIRIGR
jgi:hypothetical protein